MNPSPPRFLIIDTCPVVHHGVTSILSREWLDSEVNMAVDFSEALDRLDQCPADLLISEFRIGESTIAAFLETLAEAGPPARCLVFSSCDEIRFGGSAIRGGASGFLAKTAPAEDLIAAVRSLLAGHTWLSERLAHALATATTSEPTPTDSLTRREVQIYTHLGHGHTVSQIAVTLGLSVKTVEAHREHIKSKLGLHNASQVTAAASRWIEDFSI